jgi:phosphate uptake regulator
VQPFEQELAGLKEKLLTMASHAESSVRKAIEALGQRDYDLALGVQ